MPAQRFHLTTSAAPYTPSTLKGGWEASGSLVNRLLGTAKAGALTDKNIVTGSGANRDEVLYRAVSAPLAAQTISGTLDACFLANAGGGADAAYHLHLWVTQGDSDTVRGTLLSGYAESHLTNEFPASRAGKRLLAPQTLTDVAVTAGDRLVLELGARTQLGSQIVNISAGGLGDEVIGGSTDPEDANWLWFSEPVWLSGETEDAPAVRYGGGAHVRGVGVTSLAAPLPPNVADGDALLLVITTSSNVVATVPAGWTTLESHVLFATSFRAYLAWRVAASEPASYTVSFAGSTNGSATIYALPGAHASTPVDDWAVSTPASSTTPASGTVTTTGPDRRLAWIGHNATGVQRWTAPGGTQRHTTGGSSTGYVVLGDAAAATAGNYSSSGTLSAADVPVVFLVALTPAATAAPRSFVQAIVL